MGEDEEVRVPAVIDRWHVVGVISVGKTGFGDVFKVVDTRNVLRMPAAMKLVRSGPYLPDVQALALAGHPNIVRYLDDGICQAHPFEGIPFLVMEYAEGTLEGDFAAGICGPDDLRMVFAHVLAGLSYLHDDLGIMHGDVKEPNILRVAGPSGDRYKLGDFGLARSLDDRGYGHPGSLGFTRAYAAPELTHDPPYPTKAADLYALGVTAHHLLTGLFVPSGGPAHPSLPEEWRPFVTECLLERHERCDAERARSLLFAKVRTTPMPRRNDPADIVPFDRQPPIVCAAASRNNSGSMRVVASAPKRPLRATYSRSGAGWSRWERLDPGTDAGVTAVCPAMTSTDDGRSADWFIGVADGAILHMSHTASAPDELPWHGLRGAPAGAGPAPTASSYYFAQLRGPVRALASSSVGDGHFELYALTGDGRLQHCWWRSAWGDWSGWEELAGPDGRRITALAAGHRRGHQELYVGCDDGTVLHRYYFYDLDGTVADAQWSDWGTFSDGGGSIIESITTSSLADGHMEVFTLDRDGRLRHRWYWEDLSWSAWEDMPAPGARPALIVSGSHAERNQELVAFLADGSIAYRGNWIEPAAGTPSGWPSWWSEWQPLASLPL